MTATDSGREREAAHLRRELVSAAAEHLKVLVLDPSQARFLDTLAKLIVVIRNGPRHESLIVEIPAVMLRFPGIGGRHGRKVMRLQAFTLAVLELVDPDLLASIDPRYVQAAFDDRSADIGPASFWQRRVLTEDEARTRLNVAVLARIRAEMEDADSAATARRWRDDDQVRRSKNLLGLIRELEQVREHIHRFRPWILRLAPHSPTSITTPPGPIIDELLSCWPEGNGAVSDLGSACLSEALDQLAETEDGQWLLWSLVRSEPLKPLATSLQEATTSAPTP